MTVIEKTSTPVAKIVGGNKRYPGVVALDNVDFTLSKGEVRALLGKNGAGKSTLIRMLTGSESPDSGEIWLNGTRLEGNDATLTRRAAELGVRAVYQELSLVEGLTVAENLCLGQWPRRNGMIDQSIMARQARPGKRWRRSVLTSQRMRWSTRLARRKSSLLKLLA